MKITKYSHACLFIDDGREILVIDPGKLTNLPADLTRIRTVIVSEEHFDHFDIPNIKKILAQSPGAKIFTTKAVGESLDQANISNEIIEGQKVVDEDGFNIKLVEGDHAIVHGTSPCRVLTVSIDNFLYYPSDSFITSDSKFKVLAVPMSGPWHKISEAVNFANAINSDFLMATHNGLHNEVGNDVANGSLSSNITDKTRQWLYLADGESKDFG